MLVPFWSISALSPSGFRSRTARPMRSWAGLTLTGVPLSLKATLKALVRLQLHLRFGEGQEEVPQGTSLIHGQKQREVSAVGGLVHIQGKRNTQLQGSPRGYCFPGGRCLKLCSDVISHQCCEVSLLCSIICVHVVESRACSLSCFLVLCPTGHPSRAPLPPFLSSACSQVVAFLQWTCSSGKSFTMASLWDSALATLLTFLVSSPIYFLL